MPLFYSSGYIIILPKAQKFQNSSLYLRNSPKSAAIACAGNLIERTRNKAYKVHVDQC